MCTCDVCVMCEADLVVWVGTEQPGVVSLLHHHKGDPRLVAILQLHARLPDGDELVVQDLLELTLADPVPVEDDPLRLEAGALVELYEHLPDHGGQLCYDLLPVLLHPHSGTVTAGVGVHTGHQLGGWWGWGGGGGGGGRGQRREGGWKKGDHLG